MDLLSDIQESLTEILDIEAEEITPETYIIRELGAESIDLLELSVALNSRFRTEINDEEIFLKTLRISLNEAMENRYDYNDFIGEKYPFLERNRIGEILADIERGPVLKVKDLMAYISWQLGR
jgi:acyl carrier protein